MSTAVLPDVQPPVAPDDPEVTVEVAPELSAYRARLRRRMLLWSLPVVLLVALVAVKLLSLPILAAVTQATYASKSYDDSVATSDALGPVNVLEPWVRYFDRGTALAQIGVLVDARSAFESALTKAPAGDTTVECTITTDLVLVVEEQGDSAVLDQNDSQASAFYSHALALIKAAPSGCFTNPRSDQAPKSAKPLQDAQSRLEQKQKQAQQQAGGSGGTSQGGSGQSGQGQSGSQGGQGQSQGQSGSGGQSPLDKLNQQNQQAQQEQQQNNDRTRDFGQNPQTYSGKPW